MAASAVGGQWVREEQTWLVSLVNLLREGVLYGVIIILTTYICTTPYSVLYGLGDEYGACIVVSNSVYSISAYSMGCIARTVPPCLDRQRTQHMLIWNMGY